MDLKLYAETKLYNAIVSNHCHPTVQRIRSTVDEREQKQLLMDLEVVMRSNDCPCIVQFYGAIFKEVSQV